MNGMNSLETKIAEIFKGHVDVVSHDLPRPNVTRHIKEHLFPVSISLFVHIFILMQFVSVFISFLLTFHYPS